MATRFRKTLTFLILATGLVFALSAWAQQKHFTRNQVQDLVRDGLGDESGAKLVEQRGIDFAPVEDFLQSLKAAGSGSVCCGGHGTCPAVQGAPKSIEAKADALNLAEGNMIGGAKASP